VTGEGVIVIGAGGGGVEVAEGLWLAARDGAAPPVLGFLDDDPRVGGHPALGLAVLGRIDDAARFGRARFVLGIAADRHQRAREAVVRRLALPPERWLVFVHPSAHCSPSARLGAGTVLMEQSVVGPRCELGEHVRVCARACVGHDARLADGVVVAPAATISGRVRVGEGAYVGAAAAIAPDLAIGARARVGLGAVVVHSVDDDAVVVGNPARAIVPRGA
jgi:sugar O-acyltransferase (sialic acid O-acetyltransferase NeuD family)